MLVVKKKKIKNKTLAKLPDAAGTYYRDREYLNDESPLTARDYERRDCAARTIGPVIVHPSRPVLRLDDMLFPE